jgi:hypothetical protein
VNPRRATQNTRNPQSQTVSFVFSASVAVSALIVFSVSCGKKGPPLPPLVRLPVAPTEVTADRRGSMVELRLIVPSANTDGSRPANVESVDVYAATLPAVTAPLTDAQWLKVATKVASVDVKAPRDPNDAVDPDDPDDEMEPAEGNGLDQGAEAKASETIDAAMLKPVTIPKDKRARAIAEPTGPLIGPPPSLAGRTYAAVGITTHGKPGPVSKRVTVPLVPPPPAPSSLKFTYDETHVTLTWTPASDQASIAAAADVLPSTPVGMPRPTFAYSVYDVSGPDPVKLTKAPIAETTTVDPRIVWNEKRCYVVRTTETLGPQSIESEPSPTACDTLTDTFAPAAPKSLNAVPTDGAINLIWEPSPERDFAGYIVLRAIAPGGELQPITAAPIVEPSFKDTVASGVRYVYAVRAVDKAGNISPLSNRVEESAR